MKTLITFKVNDNKYFEILSENEGNEFSQFDEIIILYHKDNESFVVFKDFACEGIKGFYSILQKSIKGDLQLDPSLQEKGVGYHWNDECRLLNNATDSTEDLTSMYHLWSTTSEYSNETWLYNISDEIYIEVSPTYKWHNLDPIEGEIFIEFNQFMNNYAVHDIASLERNIAEKWLDDLRGFFPEILL